eukprot:scaffold1239_cov175-Pinguiococcus_pyrenoidosus.AAC.38
MRHLWLFALLYGAAASSRPVYVGMQGLVGASWLKAHRVVVVPSTDADDNAKILDFLPQNPLDLSVVARCALFQEVDAEVRAREVSIR